MRAVTFERLVRNEDFAGRIATRPSGRFISTAKEELVAAHELAVNVTSMTGSVSWPSQ